jgi:hypothetical protein
MYYTGTRIVQMYQVPMVTRQSTEAAQYLTSITVEFPFGAAWKALDCKFCLHNLLSIAEKCLMLHENFNLTFSLYPTWSPRK